jgi:hypothetical protein
MVTTFEKAYPDVAEEYFNMKYRDFEGTGR